MRERSDRGQVPAARHRDVIRDVFGEVLPDITSDERDSRTPDRDADTWYRENLPPHYQER